MQPQKRDNQEALRRAEQRAKTRPSAQREHDKHSYTARQHKEMPGRKSRHFFQRVKKVLRTSPTRRGFSPCGARKESTAGSEFRQWTNLVFFVFRSRSATRKTKNFCTAKDESLGDDSFLDSLKEMPGRKSRHFFMLFILSTAQYPTEYGAKILSFPECGTVLPHHRE